MFDWLRKLAPGDGGIDEIRKYFGQMLEDGRHTFDLAANALLGGTDTEVITEDIWATDKRINHNERRIRRLVTTRATAHGAAALPTSLVFMSLVKDAERIGDYAKNILDLARRGEGVDADSTSDLVVLKDRISRMMAKARNVFESEDEAVAAEMLAQMDAIRDHCNDMVDGLTTRETGGGQIVAAALSYRFFKRIVSHTMNIVTSLVLPLDQLDYYDEDRVGRLMEADED